MLNKDSKNMENVGYYYQKTRMIDREEGRKQHTRNIKYPKYHELYKSNEITWTALLFHKSQETN